MASTAASVEKFCMKDGEINAPELDFLLESLESAQSRRFTRQYAFYCSCALSKAIPGGVFLHWVSLLRVQLF